MYLICAISVTRRAAEMAQIESTLFRILTFTTCYLHMPERLIITVVCLHISAALYVLSGLMALVLFINLPIPDPDFPALAFGIGLFVLCLVLAIGVEITIWGLRKLKYWAWIMALVLCGLYIPSLFFILGGLGLWGVLDARTQAAFQAERLKHLP
jgi:hypothetical protein